MSKRALAFILVSVIMLSVFPYSAVSEEVNLYGDVNFDGVIDKFDYILCKRSAMNTVVLNEDQLDAADINRDGALDKFDYILIKRHVMGTYVIIQPDVVYVPNVVSAGKQYTVSAAASDDYEDSYNCELTDGVFSEADAYWSGTFSGYNSNVEIVVDLSDDGKNLSEFELSYLSTDEAGIYIPKSIKVYGSNDKSEWNHLGNMAVPQFENGKVMRAALEIPDADYRYIRFAVERTASWVFIDEIFVYSSDLKIKENNDSDINNLYVNNLVSDSEMIKNRESVFTGKAFDKTSGSAVISLECPYTIECSGYDWRSGKDDSLLTDGSPTGAAFELKEWVGINMDAASSVTVDLGEVREDLYAFELHCFARDLANIVLPGYCDISVSSDGKSFVHIGRNYTIETDQENFSFRLAFSELVKARYVRFSLPKGNGYCWIEEAAVYSNCTFEINSGTLYGDLDMEFTSMPKYWNAGSDYDTDQNLLLGLPQQIVCATFLDYATYIEHNTPETDSLLTDGVTTDNTYCYNGYWFHFNYGGQRNIYYDLGAISNVSEFSVRILDYGDWSIYLPAYVRVALSENGTDWYLASDVAPVSNVGNIVTVSQKFDKNYRARYVMFCFDLQGHVFIDEITLNGKKNVADSNTLESLPEYTVTEPENGELGYAAPSDDLLGGVSDIALIYHNTTEMDEDFFLPYVAYVDETGDIADTMFDGYLFLPSTGSLPSGGRPYGTNTASDWNYLFDEIFAEGRNFDALNKTCETVKNALGLSENKLKVYVTIPHMDDTLYEFGDIDFDGENDPLTTLENRVYIARYYAERVIGEFNSRGYENLELCGFYWFHEEIHGSDITTAIEVNKMFDEIGYQLFWIPYFNASGYSRWEEFGFDVGCLQPNYAFSLEVRENRIEYATELAKRYGMCIEMEIHDAAIYDMRYFKKYMGYLTGGVKFGYMNDAIHMYYQSAEIFGDASRAVGSWARLVYDYTYQFIKGTLDPTPDVIEGTLINLSQNKPYFGCFNNDSGIPSVYRVATSPEHGSVTVSENGEFVYCPNKDFKGTDTFTYQYSNYLDWSEEIIVTVTVE